VVLTDEMHDDRERVARLDPSVLGGGGDQLVLVPTEPDRGGDDSSANGERAEAWHDQWQRVVRRIDRPFDALAGP
jgi:hypothetical protein